MALTNEYGSAVGRQADVGSAFGARRDDSRGTGILALSGRRVGSSTKSRDIGRAQLSSGGMPKSRVRQAAQPLASFDDVMKGFN